ALEADGWIPIVSPIQIIEKQIDEIVQLRKAKGLSMDEFHVTPFVNAIFGDSPEKMELLRRHLHHYFATMGSKKDNFYNKMLSRIGFAEVAANIIDLFHQGKVAESIKAVSDELIAATCIFGSKDEIQQKISDLLKTGITRPLLGLPLQAKVEHATELLDALTP
ncbi:MAG: LLM class flavin-dependent oxidoreductase, partial [Candidatus Heimdallarchaeota archaeon]|nr:LLM class flavin-dependent oxidoreductase [Candidatus Heimdallarchaeota archaeon]